MIAVTLNQESAVPIYRQIAEQIESAISGGRVQDQERLPTTRALATELGINRLTVSRAYAELSRRGLIASRVGSGTWVTPSGSARAGNGAARSNAPRWPSLFARTPERAVASGIASSVWPQDSDDAISFAWVFPDPDLCPVEALRRAVTRVLRKDGGRVLGYGPPAGHPPLRRMIARDLQDRGVSVGEEEIIVTSGSQQGIDLVARALLDPGDRVLVEDPTYVGAVQVFQSYGAELEGVPMDEEGAIVELAAAAAARPRTKLIYVMPNFQNPTSRTMSLKRREALVALAASEGLAILEDDFGGSLRYEGIDLPPLKALDPSGSVIYLSTFGKKLFPGLRIGWLAAPGPLAQRLIRLKAIADYSTSLLLQAAAHQFCAGGDLDRHLAKVVPLYRERRDAMMTHMREHFPPEVSWTCPDGGLVVWVTLPGGVSAEDVAMRAENRSVLVGRGDLFHLGHRRRENLRLSFSQEPPKRIAQGIRILGEVIKERIEARPSTRHGSENPLPLI